MRRSSPAQESFRLRSSALALSTCLALAAWGCACGPERVAELREADGIVDRDDAAAGENWQTTIVGDNYTWNEAVRTVPNATASILLGSSSGIRMQPGTIVRFLRQASDRTGVQIANGEAELESHGSSRSSRVPVPFSSSRGRPSVCALDPPSESR
ncbi:MAG: hypothetical protein OHK0013_40600 [Sandaracinaceae bacterium]